MSELEQKLATFLRTGEGARPPLSWERLTLGRLTESLHPHTRVTPTTVLIERKGKPLEVFDRRSVSHVAAVSVQRWYQKYPVVLHLLVNSEGEVISTLPWLASSEKTAEENSLPVYYFPKSVTPSLLKRVAPGVKS